MIEAEKETLFACGHLQQSHLMVLSTAEGRFRLRVYTKDVTREQIVDGPLSLVLVQDDVDFIWILH